MRHNLSILRRPSRTCSLTCDWIPYLLLFTSTLGIVISEDTHLKISLELSGKCAFPEALRSEIMRKCEFCDFVMWTWWPRTGAGGYLKSRTSSCLLLLWSDSCCAFLILGLIERVKKTKTKKTCKLAFIFGWKILGMLAILCYFFFQVRFSIPTKTRICELKTFLHTSDAVKALQCDSLATDTKTGLSRTQERTSSEKDLTCWGSQAVHGPFVLWIWCGRQLNTEECIEVNRRFQTRKNLCIFGHGLIKEREGAFDSIRIRYFLRQRLLRLKYLGYL